MMKNGNTYIKVLVASAIALTAFGESSLILSQQQYAVAANNPSDFSAITSQSDYSASDSYIVWLGKDSNGIQQIYAKDRVTGQVKAVTQRSTSKDVPFIKGTRIVWADKGTQSESSSYWDIYMYDLATNQEVKLNTTNGEYANPSIDGQGVVWTEKRNFDVMIYHDLTTGKEFSLGQGKYPVISNNKVVYKHARDGGLSVLELKTGNTRTLIKLGGNNYVDWFVTNGDYVLYKLKSGALGSMYGMISLTDYAAVAQELTPFSVKTQEYAFMSIGDGYAAFLEDVAGQAVLKSVDLSKAKVSVLETAQVNKKYMGIVGNQLLVMNVDGAVSSIALSEGGGQVIVPPGSGAVVTDNTDKQANQTFVIGASGGTIQSDDSKLTLNIPAGVFSTDTKITLTHPVLQSSITVDETGKPLVLVSNIWDISSEQKFNRDVQLTLTYNPDKKWENKLEQLGIYRFENGHFTYVGGVTRLVDGRVVTSIDEPGTYAVLLRDITYSDVASTHWAASAIHVLSARGIVNGMNQDQFGPNGTLTRAQFSKMLAGALGISPVYPKQPTFSDVKTESWSYGWVEAVAAAGIVEGSGGKFNPDSALTREQMMTMLVRAVETKLTSEDYTSNVQFDSFTDASAVSQWAKGFVEQALKFELVQGSNNQIKPLSGSTRAEAATVIYRLLGKLNVL